ncbi:hypothetical protein DM02DRAFT_671025 [Periconia macrospinosa]|uniref:Uncharacterized protein n=1 Tax=Periconia macrospinosa TaxID=97972 RepID=A0A2V1DUH3_9PLEO|nr:hypothetical protein DM02DRAFT_671025 [Periconia macrospinosa]
MFEYGSMKRPSLEPFDEDVRLKRPRPANTLTPVNKCPDIPYVMPQYPVAASKHDEICSTELHTLDDLSFPVLAKDTSFIDLETEPNQITENSVSPIEWYSSLAEEETLPQICLGVIPIKVTSASHGHDGNGFAPVDLETFGDSVRMVMQNSGKYAGLIRSPAIRQLLDDATVQLCATLTWSSQPPSKPTRKSTVIMSHDFEVRIVILSTSNEKVRVGRILSNSDHFLQHPYVEECGDLEYLNPHFLLRPGAAMPKLQKAVGFGQPLKAISGTLNEVNKHRIARIFDVASHDSSRGISPQIFTSPRLRSELKPHQLEAIAMMVEREGGRAECCQFPSLWEMTKYPEPSKRYFQLIQGKVMCFNWTMRGRYRNLVTGNYSGQAAPSMGGLLADDMGLGKTMSTLGLVCLSIDSENSNGISSQTTLVVTTKSTLPGWGLQIDQHIHVGQLRTAVYHGSNRDLVVKRFDELDLVLTTYETLRSEFEVKGPLYEKQWHRIVLDEAHHIRNRKSQLFNAVCSIPSSFRWCLTGTPVHNSLDDYGSLLSFLGVPGFTTKATFDQWITRPIQQKNPEGFKRLQILVRTTCLRRTKESIGDVLNLPPRKEETESVQLHPHDQELYDFFKEKAAELALGTSGSTLTPGILKSSKDGSVLSLLNFLRLICNHGRQVLPETALTIWNARDQPMTDIDEAKTNGDDIGAFVHSAKILALLGKLRSTHTVTYDNYGRYHVGKSVVFSYWTKMLDLVQRALANYQFKTCRIDGSTSLEERSVALKKFNEDPDCSVMLATIGSAGEGLDLTVANHVHLMEPHWNPMAETQAVDRVYRIGQQREVTVTRYIVPNSIETYIQWVQQQKMKLISNIVDTEEITQAEIDMERWKQLRDNLGCTS